MKKSSKKTKLTKMPVSMKEALSELDVTGEVLVKAKRKGFSFRDWFWNYPEYLSVAFRKMVPFSYMFLFLIVGFLLSVFIQSSVVATVMDGTKSVDTFTEGSIGAISTFNPLFTSVNYIDRVVQDLVFDKFVYIDADGNPVGGVASGWRVSDDRLKYEFDIRDDIFWQDGSELTVDDVLFTFKTARTLAEDYGFDSVGISLIGVDVSERGGKVVFELDEPNPTFFEAVSLYIVPKSRLGSVDLAQLPFNMFARYPLGSGRYKVVRTEQNSVYLSINPYDEFDSDVKNIVLRIYPDRESLEMSFRIGVLDAVGGWDLEQMDFTNEYGNFNRYEKIEDYRTKLIFFNTRKDSLKEREIRQAVNFLVDREKLLELSNVGGRVRKGPFVEGSWVFNDNVEYYLYNPSRAAEILTNLGYVKDEESGYFETENQEILSFTLSYFNSYTNERLVSVLQEMFKDEGIVLRLEKLNYNQITQEIIATRDFELLLYEVETTIDPDQYNLWHSLKGSYPDLNISGYSYERVDILLEDGRKTSDRTARKEKYDLFQRYLMADSPVIFLYSPNFYYFVRDTVRGVDLTDISYSSQRFNNIQDWKLH